MPQNPWSQSCLSQPCGVPKVKPPPMEVTFFLFQALIPLFNLFYLFTGPFASVSSIGRGGPVLKKKSNHVRNLSYILMRSLRIKITEIGSEGK